MTLTVVILSVFVAVHFGLPLKVVEGVFVPQAALIMAAATMIHRRPNWKAVLVVGGGSFLFVAVAILLNVNASVGVAQQFLSGGQLVYMLTISAIIATALPFEHQEARLGSVLCLLVASAVAVLALLEPSTGFQSFSDQVRSRLYGLSSYENDVRDVAMAGFVRPKVFASEPSHAAWAVCALCLCAVAFAPTKRTFLWAFGTTGVACIAFYSPAAAATSLFLAVLGFYLLVDRITALSLFAYGLIAVLLCVTALLLLQAVLGERLFAGSIAESSVFVRLIQPWSLATEALTFNPIIGVGFRGLDQIWTKIEFIEGGQFADDLNTTPGMALLTIPTYTGLLGLLSFALFVGLCASTLSKKAAFAWVAVLLFCLLQKQSFVATTAWVVAAVWYLQMKQSFTAASNRVANEANETS